ncbi:MAG TPA: hypothetical protein VGL86_28860 [Polyangia bacterium]|jgi:hypothetical protein
MRATAWISFLLLVGSTNGCSCSHNAGNGNGDGGGGSSDMSAIAGGDLMIMPSDVTLDITAGAGTAATQTYTVQTLGGQDVTSQATLSVDDTTLGSFSANVFTSNVDHGGTTTVRAMYNGLGGFATLHVKLHASVTGDTCPGCPPFPGSGTPACTATAQTPLVIYPNDGTLVPPNMNVLETQFDQGTGNTLFEIDYENAATDVTVEITCNPITDSKGSATNGCSYDLSQDVWDFLSNSNRGGDPLNVIVRATDASGDCVATSSSQVAISFAQEDLNGGIYYWQSVAVAGLQGATGGIFRYDFGKRGQTPEAFLAPTASGGTMQRCVGCHFLSRDGAKMTYGNDDPDADDEYSDLSSSLIDVATKVAVTLNKPGFQAFAPDHSVFLASVGAGAGMGPMAGDPNSFLLFDGNSGAAASPATVPTNSTRATQPDYSADGTRVVFVEPANFTFPSYTRVDDNHFTGGSLYTMTASGTTFGTPQPLLPSNGENNYYPAFSPDGNFIIFNRVPLMGTASTVGACTADSCPNDAFSNPNARIFLMPSTGGTPIDLVNLNFGGMISNSWPRFAPTTQTYKGDQIAWVTFSSVRDYGDVVRNTAMVAGAPQHTCYPPESPENTSMNKNVTTDPTCLQPQLWMAAIDLTKAASGVDTSRPAFWLPFQDPTAHNHIAQWVVQLVGGPPADGGMCTASGAACTTSAQCCNGGCCSNVCGCIP